MRIFLTGVCGFIGQRLASQLKSQGHQVMGIDREPLPRNLELDGFLQGDLRDAHRYASALDGIDYICHLAAAKGDWGISEAEYHRDNVEATEALIAAAETAGVKRWCFVSTVSVLGPSASPFDETAPPAPANPYGASKAACEVAFTDYLQRNPDADVLTIRPSVVFGPDNPWNTNIYRLIDAIHRRRFVMIGAGDAVKTTSYIDNLLAAQGFLMERQLAGELERNAVFHYIDDPAETTAALVERIYQCLDRAPSRLRLPLGLVAPIAWIGDAVAALTRIDLPITSARVKKFCTPTHFSAGKIRQLGFEQPVSCESAMRRTVEWYLARL